MQKDWILLQVVTKFDNLKLDSGADVVMSSDAKYFHQILVIITGYHQITSLYLHQRQF